MLCYTLSNVSCSKIVQLDFKTVSTANNIWKVTVRNIFNEECVWHRCSKCSTNNIYQFFEPLEKFSDEEITISQWEYVIVGKEAGKSNDIIKKIQQNVSVDIVLSMLEEQLSSFSIHSHTNIIQLHHFKCQKENLEDGEKIISEDFSENYSLKQHNEIMSAHWSNEQVSLF